MQILKKENGLDNKYVEQLEKERDGLLVYNNKLQNKCNLFQEQLIFAKAQINQILDDIISSYNGDNL